MDVAERSGGLGPALFFILVAYALITGSPVEPEFLDPADTMDMTAAAVPDAVPALELPVPEAVAPPGAEFRIALAASSAMAAQPVPALAHGAPAPPAVPQVAAVATLGAGSDSGDGTGVPVRSGDDLQIALGAGAPLSEPVVPGPAVGAQVSVRAPAVGESPAMADIDAEARTPERPGAQHSGPDAAFGPVGALALQDLPGRPPGSPGPVPAPDAQAGGRDLGLATGWASLGPRSTPGAAPPNRNARAPIAALPPDPAPVVLSPAPAPSAADGTTPISATPDQVPPIPMEPAFADAAGVQVALGPLPPATPADPVAQAGPASTVPEVGAIAPILSRDLAFGGDRVIWPETASGVTLGRTMSRPSAPPEAPRQARAVPLEWVEVDGFRVNLRRGPGLTEAVFAQFAPGVRALRLDQAGEWSLVNFVTLNPPLTGWMFSTYLVPIGP